MMILKLVAGLLLGVAIAPCATWLVFAYPYSEVRLQALWIGLAAGFVLGLLVVASVLIGAAEGWPD